MIETKKRDEKTAEMYARALEEGGVWKLQILENELRNEAEPLYQTVFKDGPEHISREDYARLETYNDVVRRIDDMIEQGMRVAWGGANNASQAAVD